MTGYGIGAVIGSVIVKSSAGVESVEAEARIARSRARLRLLLVPSRLSCAMDTREDRV